MNNKIELDKRKYIERTILSNCLMDSKILPLTIVELTAENFHFSELKNIYTGIIELFNIDGKIDTKILVHNLIKKGDNKYILLIAALMDEFITSEEQLTYIKILQEYKLRDILIAHHKKAIQNLQNNEDVFDSARETSDFAFNIFFDQKQQNEFNCLNTEKEFNVYTEQLRNSRVFQTGISNLDYIIYGFYPSDLIFIGARPSVGKTALGLTIFNHMTRMQQKSAVFFSLEMSFPQVYSRLIAMNTGVELQKIRSQKLSTAETIKVEKFHKEYRNYNAVIDDTPALKEIDLNAKLQVYKQKYNIEIAFIDYIGLMRSSVAKQTKTLELGHISNSIKQMAKNFNIPIVCLAQLNRDVEKRAEQRPSLADLRDSGELEQDADTVILIHRPYSKTTGTNIKRDLQGELIIAKQRNGATGSCSVFFDEQHAQFRGISLGYEDHPDDSPKRTTVKYYNGIDYDEDRPF